MNSKTTNVDEFILNIKNMSQFRFIIFILSILFCFVVIILVLFFVPCEYSNCISSTNNVKSLWSDSIFSDIGNIFFNYIIII